MSQTCWRRAPVQPPVAKQTCCGKRAGPSEHLSFYAIHNLLLIPESRVGIQSVRVQVTKSAEALLQQEADLLEKSTNAATGGKTDLLWDKDRAQRTRETSKGLMTLCCEVPGVISGHPGCGCAGDKERRSAAAARTRPARKELKCSHWGQDRSAVGRGQGPAHARNL